MEFKTGPFLENRFTQLLGCADIPDPCKRVYTVSVMILQEQEDQVGKVEVELALILCIY